MTSARLTVRDDGTLLVEIAAGTLPPAEPVPGQLELPAIGDTEVLGGPGGSAPW